MDAIAFGKRIKQIRKSQNLTCDQLAEKAEISAIFLNHIELGLQRPSLITLEKLLTALNIYPSELFYDNVVVNSSILTNIMHCKVNDLTDKQIHTLLLLVEPLIKDYLENEH